MEDLFEKHGYTDFKWIEPRRIIVSEWVRMKCMYGCAHYGKNACCPSFVPSVSECRQFLNEYETAAILHFKKRVARPEDRVAWGREVNQGLLKLERDVFLAGHYKAFLLLMDRCRLCPACTGVKEECKNAKFARPTPEAMGIDVFSTARRYGYPIEVLSDYSQTMNRYAFLLIE